MLADGLSRRLWPLQSEALLAEARQRTGLEDLGEPPIESALSILVNSLELEADLHPLGRFLMRTHLRELIETRLRLDHAWSGQSETLDASLIQRPVFITGMPRSGSTFLHELLAEDPENRVPRVWEVMFPIPIGSKPPKKMDPRVRKAEASLWCFRRSPRERIRFTRCARGLLMSAWRSIVIRCCPKNSSRPGVSRPMRRFYMQRTLVLHIVGRNGFSNICNLVVRTGAGFLNLRTTYTDDNC